MMKGSIKMSAMMDGSRNHIAEMMLKGTVTGVTFKGDYYEIIVDVGGFKWMLETSDYAAPDTTIGLFIEPEAIHVMKKSEFSGQFGDYSSFSDEMDHLSDLEEEEEE